MPRTKIADHEQRNAHRRDRYRAAHPKKALTCADCGKPRKAGNSRCSSCRWKRYYEADPERAKSLQRERSRRRRQQSPDAARAGDRRTRHGRDFEAYWTRAWEDQDGRCYLCGDLLVDGAIHVDHDHSCCPPNRSCPACRRGLACARCNKVIGMAGDDPALLQRITGNLRTADLRVKERIAATFRQLELMP